MKKKKKSKKARQKGVSNAKLFDLLLFFFRERSNKAFNYKQVCGHLKIKDLGVKIQIIDVMKEMVRARVLKEGRLGSYKIAEEKNTLFGVIKNNNNKGCFVQIDGGEEVFVAKEHCCFALSGDEVGVQFFPKRKKNIESRVVNVIKRKRLEFVGCIDSSSSNYFLIADDRSVYFDVFLPSKHVKKSFLNKKVLVNVEGWEDGFKNPIGKVVKVIGNIDDHSSEINSILYDYGFDPKFSKAVLSCADNISLEISKKEIKKRLDVRRVPTFTIDPKDAKDFDDALSVKELNNKNWEIGVHIADVSHYVCEDGEIDKEALKRATSVYLVDRVVPMLPELLSNDLCSLKPGLDRLAYSVFFEIDNGGLVIDYKINKTIIHSDVRFTYSEAQNIIDNKKGEMAEQLVLLDRIAKILRKDRFTKGSINFESREVKFILDEQKNPTDVYFKESLDTNLLVEEFMLLANKTIAKHIGFPKKDAPVFVYRVHDSPDLDKIISLNNIIKKIGLSINNKNPKTISKSLNVLLKKVRGSAEQQMVETLVVRSMAKAVYTINNIGHYGLGFDYYTHFTSPIRRYPDLIVHRILEKQISGKKISNKTFLEKICKHCLEAEKTATQAERDSIKYMQVIFLQNKIGKTFDGVISGVTEWGLYVEITDNGCEGLVKIKSIKGDYYVYEEKKYAIIGYKTKKVYQLGQKVKISIKKTDIKRKQIDFVLA